MVIKNTDKYNRLSFSLSFLNYVTVEIKIITLSDVVPNVCEEIFNYVVTRDEYRRQKVKFLHFP